MFGTMFEKEINNETQLITGIKKEAMEFKELTNDAEKTLSSLESEIIFKNKLRIPLQIKHSEITNTEATITCK